MLDLGKGAIHKELDHFKVLEVKNVIDCLQNVMLEKFSRWERIKNHIKQLEVGDCFLFDK